MFRKLDKQEQKEEAIWAQMKERVKGHSKTQTIAVMNKTIKMRNMMQYNHS